MSKVRTLILCAGFGQRLRPLTERIPKPCLPFFGMPLLDFILAGLVKRGINDIAFNLHHLPEKIQTYVKNCPWPINPFFTLEEPRILNTGGALQKPLEGWLRDGEHLLVMNGDVLTDLDLDGLIKAHLNSDALITVAVLPKLLAGETRGILHENGLYLGLGKVSDPLPSALTSLGGFGCAYVVNKGLEKYLKSGESKGIFDVFANVLTAGEKIQTYSHASKLFDLGNPTRIWLAHREFLDNPELFSIFSFHEVFKQRGREYLYRQKAPIQGLSLSGPMFWSSPQPIPHELRPGPYFIYASNRQSELPGNFSNQSELQKSIESGESIILNSDLRLVRTSLRNHLVIEDTVFQISS